MEREYTSSKDANGKRLWAAFHSTLLRQTRDRREAEMKEWIRKCHLQQRKMPQLTSAVVDKDNNHNDTTNTSQDNIENDKSKDAPPVFNKRLFATQGQVIITKEARRVMARNAICEHQGTQRNLTKQELLSMRSVVEGLKLIHKNQDYLKDLLSHVVTIETYNPCQHIVRKNWEGNLSCYYIVHGAVEVTYDMKTTESRNVYQPNIIYSHSTGEYLGIVSAEGRDEDIAPPSTVYTKEFSEFLRIDRERFHTLIERFRSVLKSEIENFLKRGRSILSKLSDATKARILPLIEKQEYPPNRQIIQQGEVTDFLYVIKSGRCECHREVYIQEANVSALFYMCSREADDFFGEECIVAEEYSYARVIATCTTVCYKLPRIAFEIINKDNLLHVINNERHEFPEEQELMDRGYRNTIWNNYKFTKIKETLQERGKLRYMCTTQECPMNERPPSEDFQRRENMYRFALKGSHMEPFRAKSAINFTTKYLPLISQQRPATAAPRSSSLTTTEPEESSDGSEEELEDDGERRGSTLLSVDLARTLDKHYSKDMTSDDLLQILEEENELSRHLKKAWESHEETDQEEKEGFMRNGVLVTMKSDDIVRKAMAMADQQAQQTKKRDKHQEEEWDTILHAENKQAKFLICANEARIKMLRKKLDNMNKKKAKTSIHRYQNTTSSEGSPEKKFLSNSTDNKDTNVTNVTSRRTPIRQRSLENCTKYLDEDGDRVYISKGAIRHRPSSAIVTQLEAKQRTDLLKRKQGLKAYSFTKDNIGRCERRNSLVLSTRKD